MSTISKYLFFSVMVCASTIGVHADSPVLQEEPNTTDQTVGKPSMLKGQVHRDAGQSDAQNADQSTKLNAKTDTELQKLATSTMEFWATHEHRGYPE
jgi:hypothetical protein